MPIGKKEPLDGEVMEVPQPPVMLVGESVTTAPHCPGSDGTTISAGHCRVQAQVVALLPSTTKMSSINWPGPVLLVSVPKCQRNCTELPAALAGRLTIVATKPPELPDHAGRLASGLLKFALIVLV